MIDDYFTEYDFIDDYSDVLETSETVPDRENFDETPAAKIKRCERKEK